jgi:hypothetical protein
VSTGVKPRCEAGSRRESQSDRGAAIMSRYVRRKSPVLTTGIHADRRLPNRWSTAILLVLQHRWRTAGLKYSGADLSRRSPCPQRVPGYRFTTRPPSTALVRLARVEQSAPPRSPGRFWRPLRPFPLRFGQQGAAFPLRHDAGGMGMTATFVVALGVQQRVGVHRQ